MGDNIENLSFGIVLDSKKFEDEMKRVEGLAEKFEKSVAASLAVTNLLEGALGKTTQAATKDVKETTKKAKKQKEIVTLTREELEVKKAAGTATKAELLQLNAYLRSEKLLLDEEKKQVQLQKEKVQLKRQENLLNNGTSKDIKLTSNQLLQQNSIMKGLTSMAAQYFSVFGAATIVRNLVRITGEFEAQHTALRAILQDNAAADNIYNQLQVLAVKSPFTFQNLVGYAKQLTAFSVPVNEVYETTKKLADVSAGLGVDMGRIILAYGQVRSAEFLRGTEVRQFTEAGIPILKELADQIQEVEGRAISVGEVFDRISARQIPFAMVEEAFNRMTSAGGKFYQMQEVLAETVKGKVSNLQDSWEIMLSKIGDENSGTIKGIVNGLTNLFANYEKWIGLLGAVIKGIGLYSASLLTLNTITQAANGFQILRNGFMLIGNQQVKLSNILLPTNIALQKLSIKNTEEEAAALAALNLARKATVGVLAAIGAAIGAVIAAKQRYNDELHAESAALDESTREFRENLSTFAVGWQGVEKAYKKVADERHNAYKRALEENKGLIPDLSEVGKRLKSGAVAITAPLDVIQRKLGDLSSYGGELEAALVEADRVVKQLVSDGGELEAAIISVDRGVKELEFDGGELEAALVEADRVVKQLVSDGGELEAAIISVDRGVKELEFDGGELEAAMIVADRKIKQLVSDGGELEAAIVTVDRSTKQLVSDGGVLDAAVVSTEGNLSKLNIAFDNTAKSLKEVGLAGEPVKRSQRELEKEFKASEKTTEEYKKALNELYEKYPNFIDENVRQKIAVEDLAGAWNLAVQNMRQYYAESASHNAHEILAKDYKEQTNNIITALNAELRNGKDFGQLRGSGVLNEGAIGLIDQYVMGLISRDELSKDLQGLIAKINSAGAGVLIMPDGSAIEVDGLIDKSREKYLAATDNFTNAIEAADKTIENQLTSTRHQQVSEYLLNLGFTEDSELMMKQGAAGYESWESWQARLRKMYEKTSEENREAIDKTFGYFGLVVNSNGFNASQQKVADWIANNPSPKGVSMAGFDIKPETDIAEFADNALKQMQEDAKALARLPKEFQKEEGQSWDEYAEMLEDMGDGAHATLALRVKYFEDMSQGIWGDDVFGSQKELLKRERQSEKEADEVIRERIAALKQQFQDLKELKSAYDEFKGIGFDDKQIGGLLNNFFGVGIPEGGFNPAFESLASRMEKFSKNDAEDIRNFAAGKDVNEYAKKIEAAQKATEKWKESLEDLVATTKRLNLEGFAAELDKILVDTDSKNRKLTTDWEQNLKNLKESKDGWIENFKVAHPDDDAEKAWTSFYNGQKEALDALIKTQTEYNNKVAQGQIDKKADDWVKAMLDGNGIDLTDWGDKTIGQIDDIKTKLQGLKDQLPGLIPDELKDDAKDVNVTFDNLLKLIEKILNSKIDITDVERAKKELEQFTKDLQSVGKYLGQIGSAFSKFGGDWEGIGDAFNSIGGALSSFADINQKLESGQMSEKGGILAYGMIAFESIVSVTANVIENFREMREATEAWNLELQQSAYEYERLQLTRLDYEQENVFGVENPYSKALAATRKLREAQGQLYEVTKNIADIQVKTGQKRAQDWGDTARTIGEMATAGAAIGAIAGGGVFSWATAGIGALAGAIGGAITSIFASKKMVDVFESLGSITGGKIFDPETLELADEVLAKYDQMDDAGKALVDHWKEIKDAMRESIDTFNENIEAVVGSLEDDIKNALINGFNNGDVYSAIDDVHDYVGKTIQDLMAEIAFASAFQGLFENLEKDMRHSMGIDENGNPLQVLDNAVDYDWVDDLDKFNKNFPQALEAYNTAMEARKVALEAMGYNWNTGEGEESNNLSSGIKGITEDTANLLASYINAIRADVSYGKTQRDRIVLAMEGYSTQFITLNDYAAKVEAHTFDIAHSNRQILDRIDSVLTSDGGFTAIRTYS